jgi:signal peptidase I
MRILFNIIYYLFIVAIIVVALLLLTTLVPVPGNFKAKVVKSGSMEPSIPTGGLVFIHPSALYEVGDVITFGKDTKTQIPTTHRIIEISGEGPSTVFTTKGDANEDPDPTVTRFSDVEGKVIFRVPYLGYVLDFARKPLGFILLVGLPAIIIILDEIGKIIKEMKAIRRRKLLNATEENQQKNQTG